MNLISFLKWSLLGVILVGGGCGSSESQNAEYFSDANPPAASDLRQQGLALHEFDAGAERKPDASVKLAVAAVDPNVLADGDVAQDEDKKPAEPAIAEPLAGEPKLPAKRNGPPPPGVPQRQIVYTATVQLVVKDFDDAPRRIADLLRQFDGYIADSNIGVFTGRNRSGRWVVRIPVPNYDAFLEALGNVGVPENVQQKAQDVTQEFIDLTARITNAHRLEDRLAKLLEDRAGELKDAIEVERELARVRSEVETMEGRLRYLQNQTSLSTVTISLREEQNYVPPQAPSFGGRIASVWQASLENLVGFGQGLVLVVVGFVPWLLPLIILAIVSRWIVKWIVRRWRAESSLAAPKGSP